MTCIVAVKHRGNVFMGGDSACSVGSSLSVLSRNSSKVFVNVPYIIGVTGTVRYGQILAYCPLPPLRDESVDLHGFMCTEFVDAVRKAIEEAGEMEHYQSSRQESMGEALVGIRGRIFALGIDFSVVERVDDFDAVGCGSEVAMGCLASTKGDPVKRIRQALETSARYCNGVRGPFNIVTDAKRPR